MVMTKWAKHFIDADKIGITGICPYCNSSETDYVIVQNPAFIEVWCNTCGKFESMTYRGTPPAGRKIMTGDDYKDSTPRLVPAV